MRNDRTPARRTRVVVAEDSRFVRGLIQHILASDPEIEVVGLAGDGVEAVATVARLRPDVVTMDVHMPRASGLQALETIMADHPTPVLMISAHTRDGSMAAIRALELGAVDFIAKHSSVDIDLPELRAEIIRKVKIAARVRPVRNAASRRGSPGGSPGSVIPDGPSVGSGERNGKADASDGVPFVVLAASTGGPAALLHMLPQLPREFPAAMVIVQHMPPPFTTQLAHELATRSAIVVKVAETGERLSRRVAYVCPGFHHLTIDADHRVRLHPASRHEGECPSANRAMTSAADVTGRRTIGVVLTGMGRDGATGVQAIKRAGGMVIAQDEASALVNGMPRAAIETGCVDTVVPLERLAATLLEIVTEVAGARPSVRYAS